MYDSTKREIKFTLSLPNTNGKNDKNKQTNDKNHREEY